MHAKNKSTVIRTDDGNENYVQEAQESEYNRQKDEEMEIALPSQNRIATQQNDRSYMVTISQRPSTHTRDGNLSPDVSSKQENNPAHGISRHSTLPW